MNAPLRTSSRGAAHPTPGCWPRRCLLRWVVMARDWAGVSRLEVVQARWSSLNCQQGVHLAW